MKYLTKSGDYRITISEVLSELHPHVVATAEIRAALKGRAYALGATYLGRARVNGALKEGVFAVDPEDWEAWLAGMAIKVRGERLRDADAAYCRGKDFRLTGAQLCELFGLPLTLKNRKMVKDCADRVGTRRLDKSRVNTPDGMEAVRANVYVVPYDDWAMWKNKMKKLLDLPVQPD